MVQFGVIADDIVDASRIRERGYVPQQFCGKRRLDGVDQGGLAIAHQIGVVGGATFGIVAMKVADRPIDGADPINILAQRCVHERQM